jgi:hypothetical protein
MAFSCWQLYPCCELIYWVFYSLSHMYFVTFPSLDIQCIGTEKFVKKNISIAVLSRQVDVLSLLATVPIWMCLSIHFFLAYRILCNLSLFRYAVYWYWKNIYNCGVSRCPLSVGNCTHVNEFIYLCFFVFFWPTAYCTL